MLIKPSIDEICNISEDRYLITTLVAKRSADIATGLRPIPTGDEEDNIPVVSQAAREVAAGVVLHKTPSSEEIRTLGLIRGKIDTLEIELDEEDEEDAKKTLEELKAKNKRLSAALQATLEEVEKRISEDKKKAYKKALSDNLIYGKSFLEYSEEERLLLTHLRSDALLVLDKALREVI